MKILSTNGNLRNCFRLSPWFINEPAPQLTLRIHRWLEVNQAGTWQRIPNTAPETDIVLGLERWIDQASHLFADPDAPGAVNLMAFVAGADASMIGITSLSGQSVFNAIADLLEDIVLKNGLLEGGAQ